MKEAEEALEEAMEDIEDAMEFSGTVKTIDRTKSVISFVGESSVVNHEAKFETYTAEVTLDEEEPANLEEASIHAEVDLTSVKSDSAGLDGHFQKADFFDTANYPKATFTSEAITKKEGNTYIVSGDLTVKGITKEISFEAEITDEYLTATYNLPRKEFGIGNDTYGEKLLKETVPVTVKLVFMAE